MDLILKKVTGYKLTVSVSEWQNKTAGYYRDRSIAEVEKLGAGWYGSNGDVDAVELYEDGAGNLYKVKELTGFKDDEDFHEREMRAKILGKLSPEEQEYLESKLKNEE